MQPSLGVCFTGHRPQRLFDNPESQPVPEREMKLLLHNEILSALNDGFTEFYCGMAPGIDIWAAEVLIPLMDQFPQIRLTAVLPYPSHGLTLSDTWFPRYRYILAFTDRIIFAADHPSKGAYLARNRIMVDHSRRVIAVYDGTPTGGTAYTCRYAQKKGKELRFLPIKKPSEPQHKKPL